jgi:hypothetical protein
MILHILAEEYKEQIRADIWVQVLIPRWRKNNGKCTTDPKTGTGINIFILYYAWESKTQWQGSTIKIS